MWTNRLRFHNGVDVFLIPRRGRVVAPQTPLDGPRTHFRRRPCRARSGFNGFFSYSGLVSRNHFKETGHYFGTNGHRFETKSNCFETSRKNKTEGAARGGSLIFYENKTGKSLKHDIFSEQRDIFSEQTPIKVKLQSVPKSWRFVP